MYGIGRSDAIGSYFASAECQRLDACTQGQFLAPAPADAPCKLQPVGAIELAFDFGQPYHFKDYSTDGLFARLVEVVFACVRLQPYEWKNTLLFACVASCHIMLHLLVLRTRPG